MNRDHDRTIIFNPRPRFPQQNPGDTIDQLASVLEKRESLLSVGRMIRDCDHENREAIGVLIQKRVAACDAEINVLYIKLLWGMI